MCCPGCEAVAQAIAGRGLSDYYRLRDAVSGRMASTSADDRLPDDLSVYDSLALQSRFVREVAPEHVPDAAGPGPVQHEADLLLEGIRCTACVWLVEQTLARVPGVVRVDVNYASRRARVRWDSSRSPFSRLIAAVRAVGYRAWPFEASRAALIDRSERTAALWRLFVAGFGMMQVMMYALPVYIADAGSMSADIEQLMRWAGLVLTVPVMLYSAAPFFRGAWRDLQRRSLGMDVPVALGIGVAFAASAWSTLAGHGAVYFDSVAMFVFLLLAGRFLELLARQHAARALQHLARLVPETAHRITGGGSVETIPVALLKPGERVEVRPGETIPADGPLESAQAMVSEALLTGEARPVHKRSGAAMIGGSVNAGSPFTMRIERVGGETALSAIVRLMERATSERPRWLDLSQRAAGWFVIAILACALASGLAWAWIDSSRALWIAVSVLIVTCPCALSLALPVAMTVATGELARGGLVATRGHTIGSLAEATDVVFDKTGTLTLGRMGLLETVIFASRDTAGSLALAGTIGRGSEHPAARALAEAAEAAGICDQEESGDVRSEPGMGMEALIGGHRFRLGRAGFVAALHGLPAPVAWVHTRDTTVWLGDERGWIAAFRLGDRVRPGAGEAISILRAMGLRIHLLSGDDPAVAARLAGELGIAAVSGGATPAEKLVYVKALQHAGARVAMVGDGVNDAPVLAQADVSIALRGGSDLAQVRADAVLLSDSPMDLARAVRLAQCARAVVRQNLAWALGYNLIVLPLAFSGLVTPLIAGIGMSSSSLLVVLNALRLRARHGR